MEKDANSTQPMMRPLVEVAVDTLDAAEMAWTLGADRIELCQALEIGGLSPSPGLMKGAVADAGGRLVFAMIRLRGGDFVLRPGELAATVRDIEAAGLAGCAGVVVGACTAQGQIDEAAVATMVAAAGGMGVTFHRVFDLLPDPVGKLRRLGELGVARVLTSGGLGTAFEGRTVLAELVQARGPVVLAGGGVRADHVVELVRTTGVGEIHLAGSRLVPWTECGYGRDTVPDPDRLRAILAAVARLG